MKIKITYLIPILFFLISFNQKKVDTENKRITKYDVATELNLKKKVDFETQIKVTDTIENWQFYKDSELLFKSNIFDSNRFTAKIKTSDNYEYLILTMFYDFTNEVIERKIELVFEKKILATFIIENRSHSPFKILKSDIDKVINGNIGKEIYINYSDRFIGTRTIGVLKFTNE